MGVSSGRAEITSCGPKRLVGADDRGNSGGLTSGQVVSPHACVALAMDVTHSEKHIMNRCSSPVPGLQA